MKNSEPAISLRHRRKLKKYEFPKPVKHAETSNAKVAELEAEINRLLGHIHHYQRELARHEKSLDSLEKCTEPNPSLEALDIRNKLERQAESSKTFWQWIDRLNEKSPIESSLASRIVWIFNPVAIWHYRRLKKSDYAPILNYYKKGRTENSGCLAACH